MFFEKWRKTPFFRKTEICYKKEIGIE
ncbi:ATP-dependent Clp protease proteolytic subunit [Iris pallida]|uniref:ATP-dependent Clp protease proteolytic subunit (Plastid) n=1 Tax=Iris pallida TaxID=29817 RepID=A0AAX6EJV4_IRIPA|nr:ATP-dependent Clp protease proteolytic subunit [Iris pallida]